MKKALLIGIDNYPGENKLVGCVKDAEKMANILGRHEDGSPNFDCKLHTSSDKVISQVFIREQIKNLFQDEAECVLFYFSGHGYENDLGGYLVPQGFSRNNEGIPFTDLLTFANHALEKKTIREVVIILDCCHSGHMGNTPFVGTSSSLLPKGLSILTASTAKQYAATKKTGSVFTKTVIESLTGGNSDLLGNITVADIYRYSDQMLTPWEQRPMFKAHVQSMTVIRKSSPKIPVWMIRKLITYFKVTVDEFQLDPSFEPSHEPEHKEHEEIFSHLQAMRAVGLVEPVGAEHLYFAAIHSKRCKLTSLGRFYWKLVENGKI